VSDGDGDGNGNDDEGAPTNVPDRFDRLPATAARRRVEGRPTRRAVLEFFEENYGIAPATFEDHTFRERGAGKIWVFSGTAPDPCGIEGLGLVALRARREHWKPTLEAAQRFGEAATRNVIGLDPGDARAFLAGENREVAWDGDWGYLLVGHDLAGAPAVVGVGLYLRGELRSQVPKGRREEL